MLDSKCWTHSCLILCLCSATPSNAEVPLPTPSHFDAVFSFLLQLRLCLAVAGSSSSQVNSSSSVPCAVPKPGLDRRNLTGKGHAHMRRAYPSSYRQHPLHP
jgi:hypothetical protein